jgi:phosphoglycerate dehydrogenase-like enzyme
MTMQKILITPRSLSDLGHPSLERLRKAGYQLVGSTPGATPGEEELLSLLDGTVGWLAGVEPISARVLDGAADLKVISRNGTGIDNIDLDAAQRNNIEILRAQGTNARGVAELTFGLILCLSRSIAPIDQRLKSGEWSRRKGFELENRTLGIIGCGLIGRIVARIGLAVGMKVLAYDAYPSTSFNPGENFSFESLDVVIANGDIITLHCPPIEKPVIDKASIAKMKDDAIVINTARASLVDDRDLLEALNSGNLGGYGTDVFRVEPPGNDPLIIHDRVIATTHIGGFTAESIDRAAQGAVDNLLEFLDKQCPRQ